MLQVCIDPGTVRIAKDHEKTWLVPDKWVGAMRPYGLLVKKV